MQVVTPYLLYQDCAGALGFLSGAFGFEETLRYTGEEGYVNHAEMRVGAGGVIYMGNPGEGTRTRSSKVGRRLASTSRSKRTSTPSASGREPQAPRSSRDRLTRSTGTVASPRGTRRVTCGSSPA
jgi:hypothetical protein